MTTINLRKFLKMCDTDLSSLLSAMFTGNPYAIDAKYAADYYKVRQDLKEGKFKDDEYGPCLEDIFAEMLSKGMTLVFTDPDGKEHDVTLDDVGRGLDALIDKAPCAFADFIKGEEDAITGMNFLDCIIFGDVVYC